MKKKIKKKSKRPRKIKKKKSIFKNRFFWLVTITFVLTSGFIYLFIFSPVFQISDVQIRGGISFIQKDVMKDFVENNIFQRCSFIELKNIIILNKKYLKEDILESFLPVKDVRIRKKLPNSLIVEIIERIPQGNFYIQDVRYFLDKEGRIFAESNQEKIVFKSEINGLELGDYIADKEVFQGALDLIEKLKEIPIKVEECFVGRFKMEVRTDKDWLLIFNSERDIERQVEDLKLVLNKDILEEDLGKIEYIDLRFDKVFYKFR